MRLLLVEDDKKVADVVAKGLKAERYAVDLVHNGEDAWDMIKVFSYDLVILDLMLPKVNGLEVLKKIRTVRQELPVLVLTAKDATEEKVATIEAGADDYLTKPFAFAELLVRIKALLRRAPTNRSNVLKVADLELERITQQVRRGGRRIDLTAKEYALLEYLMTNTGRVMSRTMIIEHVWDESFEGLTNIVDVYVRHLRAKVDEGAATKLLRTVRGVGYTISEEAEP